MTSQGDKVRAVINAINESKEVSGQSFDETEAELDTLNAEDGKMEVHNAVCGGGC